MVPNMRWKGLDGRALRPGIGETLLAKRLRYFLTVAAALLLLPGARAQSGAPASAGGISNAVCLSCHGNSSFSIPVKDGETLPLYVDSKSLAHSVHAGLACTDCHSDITSVPHPAKSFPSRHAVSIAYYELCRQCHFDEYTRLVDGIHFKALSQGNQDAPTCVDCHGAHSITPPSQPRSRISLTCGRCHVSIAAAYAKSVHGQALVEHSNPDVPVCTDCHHAHDISSANTARWRLGIPQLCAHCHSNSAIMGKYGISTDVLSTYLNSFHGLTASLERSERVNPSEFTATCTDCHGVHDIQPVNHRGTAAVKAHLLNVCRQCHPGATANFPSAWIGHYEPSPAHAPLVYAVKVFYLFFIPFVSLGLILQILLHFWRVVVNR